MTHFREQKHITDGYRHETAFSPPGVLGAQRASVSLPSDVGLWDSVDPTGESGHAPFSHRHGLWVRQELGEGWGEEQETGKYAPLCVCACLSDRGGHVTHMPAALGPCG